MKWIFLCMLSICAFAKTEMKMVDKIKKMEWDGESYNVTFNNYQKEILISGKNQVVPCLENAVKSQMEILITIDSDIPIIESCKLYAGTAPVDLKRDKSRKKN